MSTGVRKWMEKGCPDIPTTPAEVSIDREELRQLRDELTQYKNERDALRAKIEQMEQQKPSEQYASVRKAWARFSHELHRSPDAPYPGMADAFEQHFSQSFIDREWRAEAATWAAAWKAAKRHCVECASVGEIEDAVVDLIVKGGVK